MSKIIYCVSCGIKVAELAVGSKIKKSAVMLCQDCDVKRIASDMKSDLNKKPNASNVSNPFNDLFKGIFK